VLEGLLEMGQLTYTYIGMRLNNKLVRLLIISSVQTLTQATFFNAKIKGKFHQQEQMRIIVYILLLLIVLNSLAQTR
jgi:hypothetical protein